MAPMKGMEMRIHKREYLTAGVIFLSVGLFGIFTDRWESLFVFFILGVAFLAIGLTRKPTPRPASPDSTGRAQPRARDPRGPAS